MIKLRFFSGAGIALLGLGLGCIDVSSIPAPAPGPLALDWKNPPELLHPSQGDAMATLGDETILFYGSATWSWDGRTWTQLHPATSPSGRSGARMATLGNKVVLFGGSGANAFGAPGAFGQDTWEWDGTTWKQLVPPSSPPARSNHTMATLGDKVVMFGGRGFNGSPLADTWEWDGVTWLQVTSGGGPSARFSSAMATLGQKTVLFGGLDRDGHPLGDTWEWDGSGWTKQTPGVAPGPNGQYAMATLGDKVVMFGGGGSDGSPLADTWEWDGVTWLQVTSGGGPGARSSSAMATLGQKAVLFGGLDRDGYSFDDTWEWNGERWLQRLVSSPTYQLGDSHAATGLMGADRHVAMAALGDKVVLWGDVGTWEWDGDVWTALAPSTSPPKRYGHALATLGDKMVLFGGGNPVPSVADTWEWDGTTWTQRDPPTSPSPRTGHAMATLGTMVVLFGGSDPDGHPLADTWEWDGTTWTARTPPVSPSARFEPAMATLGDKVVLFGGSGELGGPGENDTWEWDGTTWTKLAPASSPTARRAHAMATWNDSVILFGGFEGDTPLHDTWALTGARWTQVLPTTYPPERGDHAMATLAGEVVLVGGSDDRSTWLLGARPEGGSAGTGGGGGSAATGGGGSAGPGGPSGAALSGGSAGASGGGSDGTGGGAGRAGVSQGIPLPPDVNGHYDGSNAAGVVGSWWSTGDDYGSDSTAGSGSCRMAGFPAAACSVLSAPTPGLPFQPDPSGGMCASGIAAQIINDSTGAPAYSSIWGDIFGFNLNDPGSLTDGGNLRSQYDALAHGVTGFAFDIDAVPMGGHLQVTFQTLGTENNAAYWQGASADLSPIFSPGHYELRWPEVGGPPYLLSPPPFDPTLLEAITFHVVSSTAAPVPFSFCISNVMLLTN